MPATYLKTDKDGTLDLAYYLYNKTQSYAKTKIILLREYGIKLTLGFRYPSASL